MFKKKFVLLMTAILLITSFSVQPVLAAEETISEATTNNITWNYDYTKSCKVGGLTVSALITRQYTQGDPTYGESYKIIRVQPRVSFVYNAPATRTTLSQEWKTFSISVDKQYGTVSGGGIVTVEMLSPFGYVHLYSEPVSCSFSI